jgi:hypothetical protein
VVDATTGTTATSNSPAANTGNTARGSGSIDSPDIAAVVAAAAAAYYSSNSSGGLGAGMIAGISVGAVLIAAMLAGKLLSPCVHTTVKGC